MVWIQPDEIFARFSDKSSCEAGRVIPGTNGSPSDAHSGHPVARQKALEAMSELAWLVGHSFQSLTRRQFDWVFAFDGNVRLVTACLWRLIEDGRIRLTDRDDGQQFGLPSPVDAAAEIKRRLTRAVVEGVELRNGTSDLELRFNTGHLLQIIPDSSGYEAWNLSDGSREFIAVGGGDLSIINGSDAS